MESRRLHFLPFPPEGSEHKEVSLALCSHLCQGHARALSLVLLSAQPLHRRPRSVGHVLRHTEIRLFSHRHVARTNLVVVLYLLRLQILRQPVQLCLVADVQHRQLVVAFHIAKSSCGVREEVLLNRCDSAPTRPTHSRPAPPCRLFGCHPLRPRCACPRSFASSAPPSPSEGRRNSSCLRAFSLVMMMKAMRKITSETYCKNLPAMSGGGAAVKPMCCRGGGGRGGGAAHAAGGMPMPGGGGSNGVGRGPRGGGGPPKL